MTDCLTSTGHRPILGCGRAGGRREQATPATPTQAGQAAQTGDDAVRHPQRLFHKMKSLENFLC